MLYIHRWIDENRPGYKAEADIQTFHGKKRPNTHYRLGCFRLKNISIPRASTPRTRFSCLNLYLSLSAAPRPDTLFSSLQLLSLLNVFLLTNVRNLTSDKEVFWLIAVPDTKWFCCLKCMCNFRLGICCPVKTGFLFTTLHRTNCHCFSIIARNEDVKSVAVREKKKIKEYTIFCIFTELVFRC